MSTLYVDSSALLKRVIAETESSALRSVLRQADGAGDLLTSSSLAWVEVWRALRRAGVDAVQPLALTALSGIAEFPLTQAVLVRARRVGNDSLRSLDAIHLASALAVGADTVLTYDDRLAESADAVGFVVLAPASGSP